MQIRKLLAGLAASSALLIGTGLAMDAQSAFASTVLAGNTSIAAQDDSLSGCDTEAFSYTASATGTAATESAYLTTTTPARVGIYSDSSNKPGSLLASADVVPTATGWQTVSLSSGVSITSGTKYWLAVSSTLNGEVCDTIGFRDTASGGNGDWLDVGDNMPSTFTAGQQFSANPASIYVSTV